MGRVNRQFSAGAEVNVKIEHDSVKVFFSPSSISTSIVLFEVLWFRRT